MATPPEPGGPLPPDLRLLRWLVILLTATMLAGLLAVVWLLAVRLPRALDPPVPLPDAIALPPGVEPYAVTRGRGWVAVVTADDRILIFDAATGALRQSVTLAPAP